MKKGNRENKFLLICFVLITAISLIVVFSARGEDEDLEYYPGATVDFNIEKEEVHSNEKKGLLDLFRQMKKDLMGENEPVRNLVGTCPPSSDDYECPMSTQETERESNLWPLRSYEGVGE